MSIKKVNKRVKQTNMVPFCIESIKKEGKQIPIDVISVQRNSNNTLYIERSQFDIKKNKYLATEYYILKKITKIKVGNLLLKLNEIKKDISKLI